MPAKQEADHEDTGGVKGQRWGGDAQGRAVGCTGACARRGVEGHVVVAMGRKRPRERALDEMVGGSNST